MDKDLNKLKKTILLMKKEGVLYLKTHEGAEISLSPEFLSRSPVRTRKKESAPIAEEKKDDTLKELQDEAALFWSSMSPEAVTNG